MFSYYGAKLLILFSSLMPKSVVYQMGTAAMSLLYRWDRKRRELTISNLANAYADKNTHEIEEIAKQSYMELGKTASECLLIHTDRLSPNDVVSNAKDALKKIKTISDNAPNGVVYITAHYSNWELLCHFFGQNGVPLLGIVKKSKNRKIEENISTPFREKYGNTSVAHKKSMLAISKALKAGNSVIIAIDQWVRPPNVVQVDFFGRKTNAVKSVAALKQRLDPLVVPIFIERIDNEFEIIVSDPIEIDGDEALMTQVYYDAIEKQIDSNPSQWMWLHNRWKRLK